MLSSKRWKAAVWSVACLLAWLLGTSTAAAQASGEIWGNFTVGWLQSERLTWEIDVEPKTAITVPAGQSKWVSLALVPEVQYTLAKWVDALAKSIEVTNRTATTWSRPRLASDSTFRSSLDCWRIVGRHAAPNERNMPLRRLVPVQSPAFEYKDRDPLNGGATTTTWRLRDRQEISYPFNRKKLTADGAVYATGDVELFVLLGDASGPRFNEYRVRAGIGYRRDFSWRFEALFVQNGQRSGDSGFSTSSNAFDARVTRVF